MSQDPTATPKVESNPEPNAAPATPPAADPEPGAPETTFTQAQLDAIIGKTREKMRKEQDAFKAAALETARNELEEAKLLEDEKYKELFEKQQARTQELEAVEATRKRDEAKRAYLVKKKVDPAFHKVFMATSGDLAEVAPTVDDFQETWETAIQAAARKLVSSDPPPKTSPNAAPVNKVAELRAAEAKGEWGRVLQINNELSAGIKTGPNGFQPAGAGISEPPPQ
jgi:hypothetical protein